MLTFILKGVIMRMRARKMAGLYHRWEEKAKGLGSTALHAGCLDN
jgi:hypothetical protein